MSELLDASWVETGAGTETELKMAEARPPGSIGSPQAMYGAAEWRSDPISCPPQLLQPHPGDIEAHTDFSSNYIESCAMLVLPERKMRYTTYPTPKSISDISLQFAAVVRRLSTQRSYRCSLTGLSG